MTCHWQTKYFHVISHWLYKFKQFKVNKLEITAYQKLLRRIMMGSTTMRGVYGIYKNIFRSDHNTKKVRI